jgi:hypothetical protein
VKEEEQDSDPLYVKIKLSCEDKDHHPDHIHNERTEFSFTHAHYDLNEELTPMVMFNHIIASPKATAKDVPQPSHHRTFSLEADEINDMYFNEPEEPSKMHI